MRWVDRIIIGSFVGAALLWLVLLAVLWMIGRVT